MDKNHLIFITGISTEVGKTIACAITVEALQSDYWKPIQSGDLKNSDTMKVQSLVKNSKSVIHQEAYRLTQPMSPHASAEIDGILLKKENIHTPKTNNHLVIEGAGGLLVPINDTETIADLIPTESKIILVSKNYLGSINHTLLSVEYLKAKGFKKVGIIFNGELTPTTESIIELKTKLPILGRIPEIENLNKESIHKEAMRLKENLSNFISLE